MKLRTFFRNKSFALVIFLAILLLPFNNCGKIRMMDTTQKEESLSSLSTPMITFSDILIETTLNHPASKNIYIPNSHMTVSFSASDVIHQTTLLNGQAEINTQTGVFTFTPNAGFRGTVALRLYVQEGNVTAAYNITVKVSNPQLDFRPALAVRGPTCLMCHANVQGDVISDFGYKSARDAGPDLFFYTPAGQPCDVNTGCGTIYNIALPWASTPQGVGASILGNFIVPKVELTNMGSNSTKTFRPVLTNNDTQLVNYLSSNHTPLNQGFSGFQAKENVYIGAPTAADIITSGALNASSFKFIKNTDSDPDISGFTRVQDATNGFDYYTNTSNVVCEGDLFIDGVVYLKNLNVKTTYGCRIYATRSVFINGPITYSNVSALSNLQISSAISVMMGFGACISCQVDHGWVDSVVGRISDAMPYAPAYRTFTKAGMMAELAADYEKVTKRLTSAPPAPASGVNAATYYQQYFEDRKINLVDTRNSYFSKSVAETSYSRLLLNAPVVMSRYTGNYQGLIIAEFAMWVPGSFIFSFDPVFTGVTMLPFLDFTKILQVSAQ